MENNYNEYETKLESEMNRNQELLLGSREGFYKTLIETRKEIGLKINDEFSRDEIGKMITINAEEFVRKYSEKRASEIIDSILNPYLVRLDILENQSKAMAGDYEALKKIKKVALDAKQKQSAENAILSLEKYYHDINYQVGYVYSDEYNTKYGKTLKMRELSLIEIFKFIEEEKYNYEKRSILISEMIQNRDTIEVLNYLIKVIDDSKSLYQLSAVVVTINRFFYNYLEGISILDFENAKEFITRKIKNAK